MRTRIYKYESYTITFSKSKEFETDAVIEFKPTGWFERFVNPPFVVEAYKTPTNCWKRKDNCMFVGRTLERILEAGHDFTWRQYNDEREKNDKAVYLQILPCSEISATVSDEEKQRR